LSTPEQKRDSAQNAELCNAVLRIRTSLWLAACVFSICSIALAMVSARHHESESWSRFDEMGLVGAVLAILASLALRRSLIRPRRQRRHHTRSAAGELGRRSRILAGIWFLNGSAAVLGILIAPHSAAVAACVVAASVTLTVATPPKFLPDADHG